MLQVETSHDMSLDLIQDKTWMSLKSLTLEKERVKTFFGWPHEWLTPKQMAQAGFIYLRTRDRVQCIQCNITIENWEEGNHPKIEHKKAERAVKRKCFFLQTGEMDLELKIALPWEMLPYPKWIKVKSEYQTWEGREQSFDNENWPLKVNTSEWAEAGFFYIKISDFVRCFSCGLGLRNIEEQSPWKYHALGCPRCDYLEAVKGFKFIDQTRTEFLKGN